MVPTWCNAGAGLTAAGAAATSPVVRAWALVRGVATQRRAVVNGTRQLCPRRYGLVAIVYCRTVSTRAIVASASPDGTWKGAWNDSNSEPQQLGRVLLRRVASLKG